MPEAATAPPPKIVAPGPQVIAPALTLPLPERSDDRKPLYAVQFKGEEFPCWKAMLLPGKSTLPVGDPAEPNERHYIVIDNVPREMSTDRPTKKRIGQVQSRVWVVVADGIYKKRRAVEDPRIAVHMDIEKPIVRIALWCPVMSWERGQLGEHGPYSGIYRNLTTSDIPWATQVHKADPKIGPDDEQYVYDDPREFLVDGLMHRGGSTKAAPGTCHACAAATSPKERKNFERLYDHFIVRAEENL